MKHRLMFAASLVLLFGAFYGTLRGWFPSIRDHPTISALVDALDDDAVLPAKTPPVEGYPPMTTASALPSRKVGEARAGESAAPDDGSGKL